MLSNPAFFTNSVSNYSRSSVYVNSLMQFHANALECLAECKPFIETIDIEADMVWFRQGLRLPNAMGMYQGGGMGMYSALESLCSMVRKMG